jgi:tetrahydromethanopterin S-methyltransferase subunit G
MTDIDLDIRIALMEQKFDSIEARIEKVETKLDNLAYEMQSQNSALIKVIVGSTGTIIAGLLSTIVVLLLQ